MCVALSQRTLYLVLPLAKQATSNNSHHHINSYHPMQTDQQCGICQTGHTITNPVNLSCCGTSYCAGCINRLLTTKNIYGCTPQCPHCRKKITPTPQLDAVVQKFRQLQLQSKLDGVNSSHIETVLSSDGRSSPRSSVEGFTKSFRRSPRVCRQNPLTYEHLLKVDISDILLGGSGWAFTRNKRQRVDPSKKVPILVVCNDLLPKLEKLPIDSPEYFDVLYDVVVWRLGVLPLAEERLNNNDERVLVEYVPGHESTTRDCSDYPTSLDEFIEEFRQWLVDHPEFNFIREVVLDIAEHQRAIIQWLLDNPDQLNKVWQEGHQKQWYANWLMEQHQLDKLCHPDCNFCKGTAFEKSPFHCDGDHHGQEAVQSKRRHWHYNSEGEATTMVQSSKYNKEQFKDQKDGLKPVCSSRHMYDTHNKIRNGTGPYSFLQRWQYLLVTGLVLYINDDQCFFTDDEVDFENYTGYDTQHSTAMMNALIGEIEYASQKLDGISHLWSRKYATYEEFRDAVFREVVMVVLCKRSAHKLIDWGIARQHLFPGMPPYPFVKRTCNGITALVPRLLPPPPSTIETTSTTTSTTRTTESPTTITIRNVTHTTTITTSITTSTKVTTQQNVSQHDREKLQKEVARVSDKATFMKEIANSSYTIENAIISETRAKDPQLDWEDFRKIPGLEHLDGATIRNRWDAHSARVREEERKEQVRKENAIIFETRAKDPQLDLDDFRKIPGLEQLDGATIRNRLDAHSARVREKERKEQVRKESLPLPRVILAACAREKEERKQSAREASIAEWKKGPLFTPNSVTVTRSNNDKLGLGIKALSHGKYMYTQVRSIDPGSLFDGTALRKGMFLYSINGVECESYEHGHSLLKKAEGTIHIMAGYVRPDKMH